MARDDNGRKTGRNFASLRATFSRSTVAVNELPTETIVKTHEPKPPQPSRIPDRRQSRYTLFDLFSKPKVQTARGYHETGLESLPEVVPIPQPPPFRHEKEVARVVVEKLGAEQQKPETAVRTQPPRFSIAPSHNAKEVTKTVEYWDAPPLFQAYPQSIRHDTIQCPVTSLDTLARTQTLRKQAGLLGSTPSLPLVREDADGQQTPEATKLVSRRYSTLNETPELVDKVFVLVTAGRLVQYAGDGNYDRMPERVLQLGEKSAAFVCDLVPGKHFVLQVVQRFDGASTTNKPRSIFNRFRSPVPTRRASAEVLLVFEQAEEMDAWLKAIRGVIERLGGAKRKNDGEARGLEEQQEPNSVEPALSHRYRVSRPPSMISTSTTGNPAVALSIPKSPHSPAGNAGMTLPPVTSSSRISPRTTPGNSPREPGFSPEIQSLLATAAEGSPMESSIASSDQIRLDRLQQGSRTSVVSARTSRTSEMDEVTEALSKCSSSPPSPLEASFTDSMLPSVAESRDTTMMLPLAPSFEVSPTTNEVSLPEIEELMEPEPATSQTLYQVVEMKEPQPEPSSLIELKITRPRVSQLYAQTHLSRSISADHSARPTSQMAEPWAKRPRPDSVVGQLPTAGMRPLSRLDSLSRPRSRPLSRMLPVRPSEPNTSAPNAAAPANSYGRRYSSLPTARSSPIDLENKSRTSTPEVGTRSSASISSIELSTPPTHRARVPSLTQPSPPPQSKPLRRPASIQVRSDPAPFLSQRRPSISSRATTPSAVANSYFAGSTPSNDFLPSALAMRASVIPPGDKAAPGPKAPAANAFALPINLPAPTPPPSGLPPPIPSSAVPQDRPPMRSRTSMTAMMFPNMPPLAPPPTMPLPTPPPNLPLPTPPPSIPLPSLPPNIPLPPTPVQVPVPVSIAKP